MQKENTNTEKKELKECHRFIKTSIMDVEIVINQIKLLKDNKLLHTKEIGIEERTNQALYIIDAFCDFIDENINQILMYMP